MNTPDFLIAGGGIIGTAIAITLKKNNPNLKIVLLEKEKVTGYHASGRNSGVLHAGFYYTPDSLKAKFTKNGNLFLTDYCTTKKLSINRCGKLVVAKDERDLKQMETLFERGRINGIEIYEVTEKEARELEPRVKTFQKALFSPNTSSVDPVEVLTSLQSESMEMGISILKGEKYIGVRDQKRIVTNLSTYSPGHFINSGGLYADSIARDFGFSKNYEILPFKGLYLYSEEPPGGFKRHIYPVPDLRNPFLGVHVTVTVEGRAKLGPTAIPGLWRENYNGFSAFSLKEFLSIGARELDLFFTANFPFRELALEEIQKNSRFYMAKKAQVLAEGISSKDFRTWGKVGIRAQLIDVTTKTLVSDFLVEGDSFSTHVLNAVSPAFTASFPFAQHVVENMKI
jgi:(S)-2-hydroxyglutarate dehydrogenase